MFEEKVLSPSQFPISNQSRVSTDVCCTVIGAVFALTMFVLSFVFWDKDAFENNFFTFNKDGRGKACENGLIYSSDPYDLQNSKCVGACPVKFQAKNGFCLPLNQALRHKYLQNQQISAPYQYTRFKWVLFYSAILALAFGLIWCGIVHFFPRIAPYIAYVGSFIMLVTLGVLFLVLYDNYLSNNHTVKILMAIVCFLLAIVVLVMCCMYSYEMKFQGIFLEYATRFLNANGCVFFYIPVYLLLTLGLVALIVWQHCAFSSKYAMSKNFYNFNNVGVFEILNILQFIWGMQFLRDSFHFCVSGNATDWYWQKQEHGGCYSPSQRLVKKHWGSVVAGSFLNGFFQLPTLLAELFICHPQACCSSTGNFCHNSCNCSAYLFEIVRTDAYAYMNMSGIPFCNSAKICQKLCDKSEHFIGYHSPMKHYRFLAHVFCVSTVFLMAWFILKARLWNYGFWNFALMFVVIEIVLTWFINIHTDIAEGLQTSYLAEHQLEKDHDYMLRILPEYRGELQHWYKHKKRDGNC